MVEEELGCFMAEKNGRRRRKPDDFLFAVPRGSRIKDEWRAGDAWVNKQVQEKQAKKTLRALISSTEKAKGLKRKTLFLYSLD